jgi:tetratricopeptide (TPR) repeat protein
MGRIDFFLGVSSLVFCLGLPAPGCAHSSTSFSVSLTGTVCSGAEGQRIARAVVRLDDEGGTLLEQTYSSDSGEFAFAGLRPARFTLKVEAAGFDSGEFHVDLSLGSQRGLSVTLKPAHAQQSPASSTISARDLSIPQEARDLLASGRKKLNIDKNPQSALLDFQSAIAKAPAFYEAHYQAGLAYLALGDSSEAEKSFSRSVELSKQKFPDAQIALGTLRIHRGETSAGEELLRAGLSLNPASWPGLFELGELELSRGHLESALAAAQRACSVAPQQPVVYRLLAVIHLQQKDYPALLDNLDAYIRLDPDSPAGQRAKQLRADTLQHLSGSQSAVSTSSH